ncbi:MAG: TolC family protein [Sulfurospirillum sp.]|nr:TolC family protein [Sulfurospirillum sp.]
MKKLSLLCLLIPVFMQAQDLKSLIEHALKNNDIVVSKDFIKAAKEQEMQAAKNAYFPSVDAGGFYQSLNEKTPNLAGDTYSGYLKIGVDLYDGGRKSSTIQTTKSLLDAATFDTQAYKKSLALLITRDFFTIKNQEANLIALEEKNKQLEAQLQRVQQFFDVGSATSDEIDKLKAELSNNVYRMDATKFEILSYKKILSVNVGLNIATLDNASFLVPSDVMMEDSDGIKSMMAQANALQKNAQVLGSAYLPQVRLENTYSIYDYGRSDASHFEGLDKQNKLMLSFNVKLFDDGVIEKQKEAVLLQKKALESQINQEKQFQQINTKLAFARIQTAHAQIQSAKSSLLSAQSAYESIVEKYKAGVVDNIAYLDALSKQTDAKAQYEVARNALQVAYASYYYYTNKNIEEFIQ